MGAEKASISAICMQEVCATGSASALSMPRFVGVDGLVFGGLGPAWARPCHDRRREEAMRAAGDVVE